ncbi:unnamed protein product [Schistosoma intercalatum]|nr:unnamed protein product [Schistosoma intercalatum]
MVDHRGHEMHKSNQSNISTSITSQVNDISVSNTVSIGNNNISTDRFRDDNLEEDETDEAEETIKVENVNNEENRITHNYNNQTTDIVKMKSGLSNYTNQNDHSKSQNYDEFDSKSGIIYQKLDSFKKPYTHTITTTTNITTNTITTVTTTNSTIPLTVKLNIHKENENNLEMSKDETMRNLARRTLAIGIPGLHPSNHKTLFIFSEENAIRKYSKIIIEWGYPFFFANFS